MNENKKSEKLEEKCFFNYFSNYTLTDLLSLFVKPVYYFFSEYYKAKNEIKNKARNEVEMIKEKCYKDLVYAINFERDVVNLEKEKLNLDKEKFDLAVAYYDFFKKIKRKRGC